MIRDVIKIPLCSQAIENCKRCTWEWENHVRGVLNDDYEFEYAITAMFNWEESTQGDEYWRMLHERGEMPQGLRDWQS